MPRIRRTFPDRQLAQEAAIIADHARRKYNLPVDSHVTLDDLVDKHLLEMKRRRRDKTNTTRATTILERFRDLVGADRLVETIKTADLTRYVEARLDGDLSPQSINRELNAIKNPRTLR